MQNNYATSRVNSQCTTLLTEKPPEIVSGASGSDKTSTREPDIKDYRQPDGSADWETYRKAHFDWQQQVEENNIAHHLVASL